jgi:hypothetical protein
MKLVLFCVLTGLLVATVPGPASAGSDPAASLQHLLKDNDCEAAPDLLGDWTAQGDLSGDWSIQKLGDRKYRLMQKAAESGTAERVAFDICVAHLGGALFFDATFQVVPADGQKSSLGGDDDFFWIPLHLIGRLEIEDDALHFRLLDDAWFQDAEKSGRVQLTCSQNDEGKYILTAPSSELKQFAAQFAADPEAFSAVEDFTRAPNENTELQRSDESSRTADQPGDVL